MAVYQARHQPDLFGSVAQPALRPQVSADFVARIRTELTATLALVTNAAELPWCDLTAVTLAELRFRSIADWLPPAEADSLRERFGREMSRLWEIADRETARTI